MPKSRKIWLSALFSTALLAIGFSTYAADYRFGQDNPQGMVVAQNENIKNLYSFGSSVTVNANSSKDTNVFGGTVTIIGNTADDLTVAGGNVSVNGTTGGTAKVFGGNISINGEVNDDLVVGGGNIVVTSNSGVNGDVLMFGGRLELDAPVNGKLDVFGGTLLINSRVNGNVNYKGKSLTLGPNADLRGSLTYSSPKEFQRDPNAKIAGQVNYTKVNTNYYGARRAFSVLGLIWSLLAALVAAGILFTSFKRGFTMMTEKTISRFWRNVGIGLVTLVVTPILVVLLFLTFIGWYLALILLIGYILALLLSAIIGSVSFGVWLTAKINKKPMALTWSTLTVGVVVVILLKLIPVLGPLFALILLLAGLGAMISRPKSTSVQ